MWITQESLLLLAILGATLMFWRNSLRAREAAIRASRTACNNRGHQFLDDTVSLARMTMARGAQGWPQLRRTYDFEFSVDGFNRIVGNVTLFGARVESVYLPEGAREF